jgi:hypothetical protein
MHETSTWPAAVLTSAFGPDFDSQRLVMAISVGYFEAQRADSAAMFTVAGYVSPKARWRQFEEEWTRALRHEDLLAFDARDFLHGTRGFTTGWSDSARRKRLLDALTKVVEQHVMRAFACSVPLDDYAAIDAEHGFGSAVAGPYGLCAGLLAAKVRRWMTARHPDDLTLFVFEDGDIDHRELRRIAALEHSDGEPAQVWPRHWIDERGRRRHLRPFEACDLFIADGGAFTKRLLDRSRFHGEIVDRDRLRHICHALGLDERPAPVSAPPHLARAG